jgi:hypothetical protein
MSIPKCKECEDLSQYKIGKHTYYECNNEETKACWKDSRKIYAKCIKTSPKWCPKRKEGLE